MDIKPAYKTLEGQSLFSIVIACIYLLYGVLIGDADSSVSISNILEHAESAKEIAQAYSDRDSDLSEFADMGKSGVVFWFLYKAYSKFIDSRTELKKGEK